MYAGETRKEYFFRCRRRSEKPRGDFQTSEYEKIYYRYDGDGEDEEPATAVIIIANTGMLPSFFLRLNYNILSG